MMRSLRTLLLLLAPVLLAPAQAAEETTFYDVEIVLFENLDVRAAAGERWQPRVALPRFDGAATFERGAARTDAMVPLPRGFQPLPGSQARLDDAVRRLKDSPRYRVIRHLLWRQPGLEATESVPLRFHAGQPVTVRVPEPLLARPNLGPPEEEPEQAGETDTSTGADGETSAAAAGGDAMEPADAAMGANAPIDPRMLAPPTREVSVHPLDGTIRLVVSRYLHVHADLYYTAPVDWEKEAAGTPGDAGPDDAEPAAARNDGSPDGGRMIARGPDGRAMLSYPFVQQRRMRSGELHYLDHPVLGMLVLVTPRGETSGSGG